MTEKIPAHFGQIKTYRDWAIATSYKEVPVDIMTFLCDDLYLGKSTSNGRAIFDVWKLKLREMFSDDEKFIIVLTGAIGIGKSYIASIGVAYVMYKILCLRDPWQFFKLADSGKFNISFFNLTKTLSASRGFQNIHNLLLRSPWFLTKGVQTTEGGEPFLDIPQFSYSLGSPYSKGFGNIGEHVIASLMDEVDSPTESDKQRIRVLKAYESTMRRFESRFLDTKTSTTLAKFFLVSSKQDEMSFLEVFVEQMKHSGKVYVADIPLWEAKSPKSYCGIKFFFIVGDQYIPPRMTDSKEEADKAVIEGFRIVEVPIEYKEYFERDMIGAARDLAGISVKGFRKSKLFAAERFLSDCYDPTKIDPVAMPTVMIGLKDEVDIINFVDITKIRRPKTNPRFIHYDMGLTGDAFGLACSSIVGWDDQIMEKEDGTFSKIRVPVIETDFALRLKAKEGDEIPLHKVRKFILDLRARGFNIKKVTADLRLLSADSLQILKNAGIDADYLSVDKDIQHYLNFRNLVYEKRWKFHKQPFLHFELKFLEVDKDKGKIDHPEQVKDIELLEAGGYQEVVMKGSKDLADAVCGSIASCILSEAPMDIDRMNETMKNLGKEKSEKDIDVNDPYWFVNLAKDKDSKVVASTDNQDAMQKFIGIVRRSKQ